MESKNPLQRIDDGERSIASRPDIFHPQLEFTLQPDSMSLGINLFRISTVPISLNILLKGQLMFLNRHYKVTAISGAGKDLDEVAEREGVPVHPIQIERQISPLKDLVSLYRLYRYFRKEKPDIVHSITPKAGLLSMVAAKLAGVPVRMHTFTGLIFPSKEGYFQTLLIWMDRLICKAATHVYPEGRGVREDLIRYKITDKPLKIIANGNVNGVNLEHFSPEQIGSKDRNRLRAQLGIEKDDFVFVFVGRLVRDKGITELVSAFTETVKARASASAHADRGTFNQSGSSIKLLLVGPRENEADALSAETARLIDTHPNILSVGFQPDVRPYFAIAHVFVLPSYREGFPNAVLQAGAMDLPSIVTDINGCNEIIVPGSNGVIIPTKDTPALQKAMTKMISDHDFYYILKENARRMITTRYEQQLVWEALLEEYRAAVLPTMSEEVSSSTR